MYAGGGRLERSPTVLTTKRTKQTGGKKIDQKQRATIWGGQREKKKRILDKTR